MFLINPRLLMISQLTLVAALIVCSCFAEDRRVSTTLANSEDSCSLYASPTGDSNNTGTTVTSPLPLQDAAKRTQPGDVVCLIAGTYTIDSTIGIEKSGRADAWITYRNYDGVAFLNWTGGTGLSVFRINPGVKYIEVNGLKIDGANRAVDGLKCASATHIRFIGNIVNNGSVSGISTYQCDYITVVRNLIYHSGYNEGWGSGVTFNAHFWSDNADGFHSYVIDNIISGTYDSTRHVDGSGIIMDRGDDTPPTLIANNLIYQNGGRCVAIYMNMHKWVVNNTCYGNALDKRMNNGEAFIGELMTSLSSDVHFINNAVYAWTNGYSIKQLNNTSNISYSYNTYFGGRGLNGIDPAVSNDPSQLRETDPLFVDPIPLDPNADGQYQNAVPPSDVGQRFELRQDSSLINAGIDPRLAPGLSDALREGLEGYVLTDLNGNPRGQDGGFDIGAYEYQQVTKHQLDVVTNGEGIVRGPEIDCPDTSCSSTYTDGTQISLEATPKSGYTFDTWGDACQGQVNPCTLTMTANSTVSANFIAIEQTNQLTVTVTGEGSVTGSMIDCPDVTCTKSYKSGTQISLLAMPKSGFTFDSWSGACHGQSNPCVFQLTTDQSVTASFIQNAPQNNKFLILLPIVVR